MTYIKYLDVYRDQKLNWKDQKTHVKTKAWVAKNIGVLYKFWHYVIIHVLYTDISLLKLCHCSLGKYLSIKSKQVLFSLK